jgi:hypothetical protein
MEGFGSTTSKPKKLVLTKEVKSKDTLGNVKKVTID